MIQLYIILLILVSIFAIWKLPQWALKRNKQHLKPEDFLNLVNEYRKTIAQIIGGIYVLIGLGFTWIELSSTKNTLVLSERRYVRESYSDAVNKLGSNNPRVRLGGIYVLTDIVQESESYSNAVVQLLSTHVRMSVKDDNKARKEELQACIDAITKNPLLATENPRGVSLQGISLQNYNFNGSFFKQSLLYRGDFSNSDFSAATMEQSQFYGTLCKKCRMEGTNFSETNMYGANLSQSILVNANLTHVNGQLAKLKEADLSGADLSNSDFAEANFSGANLTNARLDNTNLSGVDLTSAIGLTKDQMTKAIVNSKTKLPF